MPPGHGAIAPPPEPMVQGPAGEVDGKRTGPGGIFAEVDMQLRKIWFISTIALLIVSGGSSSARADAVWMDAVHAVGLGEAISKANLALAAETDSLLRAGFFGSPPDAFARCEAGRYFKFHALTAIDFIAELGAEPRVVWETSEEEIAPLFCGFANPGIYPIWGLRRILLGGGLFRMEYEILKDFDGHRMLGVRPVRLRSVTPENPADAPAWDLEMQIPSGGKAHYIFSNCYRGRVRREYVEEEGCPLTFLILDQVEGFSVERWGIHPCTALIFWRSDLPPGEWPPEAPRLGAAAYFPDLKLDLPGFLPDISINDLQRFSATQPLISAEACQPGVLPPWISVTTDGIFRNWKAEGPIPTIVTEWFPDL